MIEVKIDACFVHVATKVHGAVVRQLLQAGIHVFVDKPLSEDLAEVKELQALAAAKSAPDGWLQSSFCPLYGSIEKYS